MAEKTLTIQQVAEELGVDEATVRRLRQKAGLPVRRPGQGYTRAEVNQLKGQQRYKRSDEPRTTGRAAPGPAASPPPTNKAPGRAPRNARAESTRPDLSAQSTRNARAGTDVRARHVEIHASTDELLDQAQPGPASIEPESPLRALMQTMIEQNTLVIEQNTRLLTQHERIEVQYGRIETTLGRLNNILDVLMQGKAASMTPLPDQEPSNWVPATPPPLLPGSQEPRLSARAAAHQPTPEHIPPDLPPGTVTLTQFALETGTNIGTLKSRLKPSVSPVSRLETTQRAVLFKDGRMSHYLTPEQQRKALAQWHRHWFPHRQHQFCPEPHTLEAEPPGAPKPED